MYSPKRLVIEERDDPPLLLELFKLENNVLMLEESYPDTVSPIFITPLIKKHPCTLLTYILIFGKKACFHNLFHLILYRLYNIFDPPVNRGCTMRLQEGIGLGKMLTSKEAPISRKRTRMWSLQDQMIGIWRQKFLFSSAPVCPRAGKRSAAPAYLQCGSPHP